MLWKTLNVTEAEKTMVEELRQGGIGRRLSEEEMGIYPPLWESDFTIPTRAGDCLVHYYRPVQTDEALPLLINIHGGGFVKGRRDQDIVYCRNISSRSGFAVLDIDYVPSPDMRYPGQVYACYDVMMHCVDQYKELRIDHKRIAVGGHSAGGNLTAAIILMGITEKTFVPSLQILDYAGFDMVTPPGNKRNGNSNPRIPAARAEFYNKMYVDPEDASEIYCSPAFASDELLAQMPPTVMIYCENDTFCDESETFHMRLLKQGVPVYGRRFLNSSHGFTVQRRDEFIAAEQMILDGLSTVSAHFLTEN